MEREKGVNAEPCPGCGADQMVVINADGSTSAENCQTCYPETEKASEAPVDTPPAPPVPPTTTGRGRTAGTDVTDAPVVS